MSGEYIFETSQYDDALDTFLKLYKDDGTFLKQDDDGGNGRFQN